MVLFASLSLDPAAFMAWIVGGAICAWLAGSMMEAPSYGVLGEVFLGVIGALIGGAGFSLMQAGEPNFWITALVGLAGACSLIGAGRFVAARNAA